MTEIKTLAMLKMEKNFRGHIEKGYPRDPYAQYDMNFFVYRIKQELNELIAELLNFGPEMPIDYKKVRDELADLSNLVDFAFERTFIEENDPKVRRLIPDKIGLKQLYDENERLEAKQNV